MTYTLLPTEVRQKLIDALDLAQALLERSRHHATLIDAYNLLQNLPEQSGEPVAYVDQLDMDEFRDTFIAKSAREWHEGLRFKIPLYTAPQPAADVVKAAACMRFLHEAPDLTPYLQEYHSGVCLNIDAIDAAMSAQGEAK
jgi:hypothetical protein